MDEETRLGCGMVAGTGQATEEKDALTAHLTDCSAFLQPPLVRYLVHTCAQPLSEENVWSVFIQL